MTGEPITIRPLLVDELGAYKALRDTILAEHPSAFTSDAAESVGRAADSYRDRLGLDRPRGGHFTLGAWDGDTLVGAISCERENRIKVRHVGHLIGMMVRSDAQGRGVGRALLNECLAAARRAGGLEMLTLTVTAGNAPAIALYESVGFERCGSLPRAIRVGDTYYTKDQMVLVL
ncbi:N-acetyltransferase family protein [Rhizobacter fulvus]